MTSALESLNQDEIAALLQPYDQQEQVEQPRNCYENQSGMTYHHEHPPPYQSLLGSNMHDLPEGQGWQPIQNHPTGYTGGQGYPAQTGYQVQNNYSFQNSYPIQDGYPVQSNHPMEHLQQPFMPTQQLAQTPLQHHPHPYAQDVAQSQAEELYKARSRRMALDNSHRSVNASAVGSVNGCIHQSPGQVVQPPPRQPMPQSYHQDPAQAQQKQLLMAQQDLKVPPEAARLPGWDKYGPTLRTGAYKFFAGWCNQWCDKMGVRRAQGRWLFLHVDKIIELGLKCGFAISDPRCMIIQRSQLGQQSVNGNGGNGQPNEQAPRPEAPIVPNLSGEMSGSNVPVPTPIPQQPGPTPQPKVPTPPQPASLSHLPARTSPIILPQSKTPPEQASPAQPTIPPPAPKPSVPRRPSKPALLERQDRQQKWNDVQQDPKTNFRTAAFGHRHLEQEGTLPRANYDAPPPVTPIEGPPVPNLINPRTELKLKRPREESTKEQDGGQKAKKPRTKSSGSMGKCPEIQMPVPPPLIGNTQASPIELTDSPPPAATALLPPTPLETPKPVEANTNIWPHNMRPPPPEAALRAHIGFQTSRGVAAAGDVFSNVHDPAISEVIGTLYYLQEHARMYGRQGSRVSIRGHLEELTKVWHKGHEDKGTSGNGAAGLQNQGEGIQDCAQGEPQSSSSAPQVVQAQGPQQQPAMMQQTASAPDTGAAARPTQGQKRSADDGESSPKRQKTTEQCSGQKREISSTEKGQTSKPQPVSESSSNSGAIGDKRQEIGLKTLPKSVPMSNQPSSSSSKIAANASPTNPTAVSTGQTSPEDDEDIDSNPLFADLPDKELHIEEPEEAACRGECDEIFAAQVKEMRERDIREPLTPGRNPPPTSDPAPSPFDTTFPPTNDSSSLIPHYDPRHPDFEKNVQRGWKQIEDAANDAETKKLLEESWREYKGLSEEEERELDEVMNDPMFVDPYRFFDDGEDYDSTSSV